MFHDTPSLWRWDYRSLKKENQKWKKIITIKLTLRNDILLRHVFLEKGIQNILNLRNKIFSQIVYSNHGSFLKHRRNLNCPRFSVISQKKLPPPFGMKLSDKFYVYIFIYTGLKQLNASKNQRYTLPSKGNIANKLRLGM